MTNFLTPLVDQSDKSGELNEFFSIFWRRKNIILACASLLMAIAVVVVFQIKPRYTAEAGLLLDLRKTQVVDNQTVAPGLTAADAVITSEAQVLKSAPIALAVIKKLNLTEIPEFNPRLQPQSVLSRVHGAGDWIGSKVRPIFGSEGPTPVLRSQADAQSDQTNADLRRTMQALLERTTILNDGQSFVLNIRAESQDPELAAAIANTFADEYLNSQLEAKFDAVRRANDWLNEHLTSLRGQVEASDQAVQEFKMQHNIVTEAKDGATVNSQQLSEINSQLILAAADLAQKQSALKQIRSGGAAAAQVLSSPLIQALRKQQSDLQAQEAELATKYKPDHPAMLNIRAQEQDLRQRINDEIGKVVQSAVGEVDAAQAKQASLRDSLNAIEKSSSIQDQAQIQLSELERQSESNRTLYQNFLNRFKESSAQEDIQEADARLMSPAQVPTSPTYPKTEIVLLFALVGSLLVGVIVAFSLEWLDNGFRTGDQLEKFAQVTSLGLIPDLSGQSPTDAVVNSPVSPYSEAIRTVRTALRYSHVDSPPKVVCVTSSLPEEGKSVFSLSLARSVAFSGGRALLIDCDLRRSSLAKLLKIDPKPGLLALFDADVDPESVLHVDQASGAHFIPSIPGTANPQDLLGSQQFRMLLEKMRPHYDLIVLDAPPVLAVSDAFVLSHVTDATMFLVRWGSTPRPVVVGALKSFRTNGARLAGVVLSRVDFRRHATYGQGDFGYFYGKYGKGYGRGYGQYGETPPKKA